MKKVIILLVLMFAVACQKQTSLLKNKNLGNALGTTYAITYLTETKQDYQQEIDSVFTVVNQSMSTYLPDSDITKINNGDSTVVVDAMFKEVFAISEGVYKATQGYFDPTVGVLVNAWGFGPGKQIQLDSTKVDSLLYYVGFNKVRITPKSTVLKDNSNIRFDFNAVAKGYAIDRLAAMLEAKGCKDYLVEVGGEIYASGTNSIKQKNG